jgi:hypothetical protein
MITIPRGRAVVCGLRHQQQRAVEIECGRILLVVGCVADQVRAAGRDVDPAWHALPAAAHLPRLRALGDADSRAVGRPAAAGDIRHVCQHRAPRVDDDQFHGPAVGGAVVRHVE